MKVIFTALICIAFLSMPSYSFWSTGHMIISKIASEEIRARDPKMFMDIENDIETLSKYSMEEEHSFVEAAIWADDNKEIEFNQFTNWHFVDTPYIMPDYHGETEYEPMNVTWAIKEMQKTLGDTRTPKFNANLAISFAWRYLLHLIGDIHQPLHSSSMYSAKFDQGDMGGNLFLITYPENEQIENLHALWDACVDQYGSMYAPLNATEWEMMGMFAQDIVKAHPRQDYQARIKITDSRAWAAESFEIAKSVVYDSITPETIPTDEYITRGREVVNEQLAIGGYRLADMMISLYNKKHSVIEDLLKSE